MDLVVPPYLTVAPCPLSQVTVRAPTMRTGGSYLRAQASDPSAAPPATIVPCLATPHAICRHPPPVRAAQASKAFPYSPARWAGHLGMMIQVAAIVFVVAAGWREYVYVFVNMDTDPKTRRRRATLRLIGGDMHVAEVPMDKVALWEPKDPALRRYPRGDPRYVYVIEQLYEDAEASRDVEMLVENDKCEDNSTDAVVEQVCQITADPLMVTGAGDWQGAAAAEMPIVSEIPGLRRSPEVNALLASNDDAMDLEIDDDAMNFEIEAACRETADPLPLGAGEWQGADAKDAHFGDDLLADVPMDIGWMNEKWVARIVGGK